MPRSVLTLSLTSAAHLIGDNYYRHQTTAARSEAGFDAECVRVARLYQAELEKLREHLLNLEPSADRDKMLEDTDQYLNMVRTDLERLGTDRLFLVRQAA